MITVRHSEAWPAQRKFWASDARMRAFVGGVGSGKTRAGVVETFRQPAGSTGMVLAPTFPMLRDSTLVTFLDLSQQAGILTSFNRSTMTARLLGNRTILFRQAGEPDRLRGPNLSWAWLDEAALMDRQVFLVILGRLRVEPGRLWVTTSPLGRSNWVYKEFGEPKPGRELFRGSTRDNKALADGYIESMETAYDPEFARQEIDGEWLDDAFGQLLPESWLDRAGTVPRALGDGGPRIIGCDPSAGSGRDHCAIVVLDRLGIQHLEASNRVDVPHAALRINQLSRQFGVQPHHIVYDGSTGGGGDDLPRHLQQYGIRTATRYMGGDSGDERYANLRSRMGHRLRLLLDPQRPLPLPAIQHDPFQAPSRFIPRVANAIQPPFACSPANLGGQWSRLREEMLALRYLDRAGKFALETKEAMKSRLGRSPDLLDAVLMGLSKLEPDQAVWPRVA